MARGKRYRLTLDDPGITPSQLKRLGRARQIEYMTAWFYQILEDPVHETPRDEGEYLFIWGGPYEASAVIQDEFGDLIDFERIDEVVLEVESDGVTEWAPTSQHPDYQTSLDEENRTPPEGDSLEEILTELLRRFRRGDEIRYGTEVEREHRQAILDRLDGIEADLFELRSKPPGIGHNGAPEDDYVEEPGSSVGDALAAVGEIRTELAKAAPDAVAVVQATSRLTHFRQWMHKRWSKSLEKAVETPITAAILAPFGYAIAKAAPTIMPLIDQAAEAVVRWLQTAMTLF